MRLLLLLLLSAPVQAASHLVTISGTFPARTCPGVDAFICDTGEFYRMLETATGATLYSRDLLDTVHAAISMSVSPTRIILSIEPYTASRAAVPYRSAAKGTNAYIQATANRAAIGQAIRTYIEANGGTVSSITVN